MSKLEDNIAYENKDPKYGYNTSQFAYDRAEREGLIVITPTPNQLFIDLDSAESGRIFTDQLGVLYDLVTGVRMTPSMSGLPHQHAVVTLNRDVTEPERIAMQASLGSDRRCEILRFMRYLNNDPQPTLFLERKPS